MHDHIHQSNLIEGIDWPIADRDSMNAWLWLLDQKKLDLSVIMHLQKRITIHQKDLLPNQRGYIRGMAGNDVNVTIAGHAAPHFSMIKGLMDNWLLDYKKLGPLDAHIRFETIHPFVDGNGRTGRMLMWWQELHKGDLPTLFRDDEKFSNYYSLFVR
jgi:Fic family protein